MAPNDAQALRDLRDEIGRARAEARGVREEVRAGLERLAATWAEDAKQRHDLSEAIKDIAKTTKKQEEDIGALKVKQLEDDHDKTRAKTGIALIRIGGGFLLSLALTLSGYLLRSYIEVRDQTRDHTAQIAAIRETETRAERERTATSQRVQTTSDEVIQVRTRLTSIDSSLRRIEDALEAPPRRRR